MTRRIFTACLFVLVAIASTHSWAQSTPTRFSKTFETPKNLKNQNFANNEDSPLASSNRNKTRHERARSRNRNKNESNASANENRTASENVNTGRKQGRRQTGNQNRASQKVNEIAKELLND